MQRIVSGDWIGIGFSEAAADEKRLVIVAKIKDAKFGRRTSAVGDGVTNYVDIRFVHHKLLDEHVVDSLPGFDLRAQRSF